MRRRAAGGPRARSPSGPAIMPVEAGLLEQFGATSPPFDDALRSQAADCFPLHHSPAPATPARGQRRREPRGHSQSPCTAAVAPPTASPRPACRLPRRASPRRAPGSGVQARPRGCRSATAGRPARARRASRAVPVIGPRLGRNGPQRVSRDGLQARRGRTQHTGPARAGGSPNGEACRLGGGGAVVLMVAPPID